MASVDLGPILSDDDEIAFSDSHRPAMLDGAYEVTLTQSVTAQHTPDGSFTAARSLKFAVAGPRFALAPNDIASVFPPKNADGDFTQTLPHVMLTRASLPWERTALAPGSGGAGVGVGPDEISPWLALLVFTEEEIAKHTKVVKAGSLTKTPGQVRFPPLPAEATDDANQPTYVLDLPHALAEAVLPTIGEVELLSSVRSVNGTGSRAIVVANRMCRAGHRHVAHLVSLEGQYRDVGTGGDRRTRFAHWSSQTRTRQVRLISLARWSFHCSAKEGDFGKILGDVTPKRLSLPSTNLGKAKPAVEAGAVPLAHLRASGDNTASWYHGPLATAVHQPNLLLPVRHADALLRTDLATGLVDISYAAAWELGRQLALADPKVGPPLFQWKRRVQHAAQASKMQAEHGAVGARSHPPGPFPLTDWFANALGKLAAVPWTYLLPDPKLLPVESVAFFRMDPDWMDALYDGAFSIGRTGARHMSEDAIQRAAIPPPQPRSGLLLRSRAVTGWPDMIVDGFDAQGQSLGAPVRFERMGEGILLVLFDGMIARAEAHLHPQAMHFGFGPHHNSVAALPLRSTGKRVANICDLQLQGLAGDLGVTTSRAFAQVMIDRVPKVIFETGDQT